MGDDLLPKRRSSGDIAEVPAGKEAKRGSTKIPEYLFEAPKIDPANWGDLNRYRQTWRKAAKTSTVTYAANLIITAKAKHKARISHLFHLATPTINRRRPCLLSPKPVDLVMRAAWGR
nr:unnamed protein product [Spirometra erinaceieuropaei]